jgi:integrase
MLPGAFDSPESRAAFGALLLELQAAPHHAQTAAPNHHSLADLLLAYLDHAERHYRGPAGTPTSEIYEVKIVIRALRELYGDKPIAEFGPLCVKAARQRWVNEGRSRTECNRRVGLIKRIFKWAVSEELAPAAVYQAVSTITGLQKGRTVARELEPIGPVDDAVVDATLPHLNRHVRGMVEFQRLTGSRPGEVCSIRRADIEMGGAVWLYKPATHKTAWRGKSRVIAIGPKAQGMLREFFTPDITDYLFSPRRAVEELNADRSAKRKTPRYRSHMERNTEKRVKNPRRTPSEKYDPQSYGTSIDRACDRAFPLPSLLAQRKDESHAKWWERLTPAEQAEVKVWRKAHRWHPNQLRHSYATKTRKVFGLEHAGAALGHSKMKVTEVYAERDAGLALEVAVRLG